MLKLSTHLQNKYVGLLQIKNIPQKEYPHYLKWLRYYLDFCHKYEANHADSRSLPRFIDKLRSKKQNEHQQQQAAHAVRLYYSIGKVVLPKAGYIKAKPQRHIAVIKEKRSSYSAAVTPAEKSGRPQLTGRRQKWQALYVKLANEIKMRHYSSKTLKTYAGWLRKLQAFTRSKDPDLLDSGDVKHFLTHLAVEKKMSASSQNQAFNALLFCYRHLIGKEFGKMDGVVRAKKKPYIPVVLSKNEVYQVFEKLSAPYDLVVKLLYGCGLRLFECLNLRVSHFNFDAGILTIHNGKGKKDRTVPIPQIIVPELLAQLENVRQLHEADLAEGYAGAFMFDRFETKYKNAGREFIWQWFFPAKVRTYVEETKESRRYHLHDTHVQRAIKKAVGKSGLTKRATAHTFRHSYASHLLEANYDIRTIQTLLGHSDVRTTMIYTHTVTSRTIKDARSPLDI